MYNQKVKFSHKFTVGPATINQLADATPLVPYLIHSLLRSLVLAEENALKGFDLVPRLSRKTNLDCAHRDAGSPRSYHNPKCGSD